LEEDDPKPDAQPETKDWLVEDFPVALRWKCKEAASHRHVPLKKFVQEAMQKAVEQVEAEVLNSANESREEEIRRGSEQTDSSATGKAIRRKAKPKAYKA
jgi:hypothetical protein